MSEIYNIAKERVMKHPQADILRQIADEAEVNPEPWKAFEGLSIASGKQWIDFRSFDDLMGWVRTFEPYMVRRKPRPKTVRVSGEVADDIIAKAKRVAHASPIAMSMTEARDIAQIFLDLSED